MSDRRRIERDANFYAQKALIKAFKGYNNEKLVEAVAESVVIEYKEKIARAQTYNIDYSQITLKNEQLEQYKKNYFFRNNIVKKLIKVAKQASLNGDSAILLRAGIDGPISQVVQLFSIPRYEMEKLMEVYLIEANIDLNKYSEETIKTMKLWFNKEIGRYVLSHMIVPINGDNWDFSQEQEVITKDSNGNKITGYIYGDGIEPLTILENNEDARPDWEYAAEQLRLSSKFSAIVEKEWEYTKIQLLNNLVYNPDKTGMEIQHDIENGQTRVHEVVDPDGRLQSAITYLSSGGVTTDIAMAIKEKYKDEVKELTFSFGQMSGGNNKHTSEFIGSHLNAFNYLYIKYHIFQEFMQKYLHNLFSFLSLYDLEVKRLFDKENILDINVQLSRALEMILNINADGTAQDPNTRINENTNIVVDQTTQNTKDTNGGK